MHLSMLYFAQMLTVLHFPKAIAGINMSPDKVYANVTGTACISFEISFDVVGLISVENESNISILTAAKSNPTAVDISDEYKSRLHYNGNLNENRVSFCLSQLTFNDAGNYRLQKGGLTISTVTLFILRVPTTPRINGSTSVMAGSYATLTCSATSQSLPTLDVSYLWRINETQITSLGRYTINGDGNNTLEISHIEKTDKYNRYRCIATEHQGHLSISNVTVLEPKYQPEIRIVPQHNPYYVINGSTFNATCEVVDANPPVTELLWKYKDKSEHNQQFVIPFVKPSDEGIYNCSASNGIGAEVNESIKLDVQYGPFIQTEQKHGTIVEGKKLRVICHVTSNPVSTIVWTRHNDPDFIISNTKELVVSKVYRNMSEAFTCKAENTLTPSGLDTIRMSVEERIKINILYGPADNVQIVSSPPIAVEGSNVTLICQADCNPSCSYSWGNKTLAPLVETQRLQLYQVMRDQTGMYMCEARNIIQQQERIANSTINITVHYQPTITSLTIDGSSTRPEGSSVTITCVADSVPKAALTLKKNDLEISTKNSPSVFNIHNATCHDTATYTCIADNGVKTPIFETTNIYITCAPRPDVKHDSNIYVEPGHILNISTSVFAFPTASVTWHFRQNNSYEETDIQSLKEFIIFNENSTYRQLSTLLKKKIKDDDFGEYTVLFKNNIGKRSMKFQVTKLVSSDDQSIFDNILTVAGLGGAAFALMVLCILASVLFYKNRKIKEKKTSNRSGQGSAFIASARNTRAHKTDEDGMRINSLYESADQYFDQPGPSGATPCTPPYINTLGVKEDQSGIDNPAFLYSEVVKSKVKENKQSGSSTIPQNDQIPKGKKKAEKNGMSDLNDKKSKRKNKTSKIYRNEKVVNGQLNSANLPGPSGANAGKGGKRPMGKRNKDGCLYADLDLEEDASGTRNVIHGLENRTAYSEVDFTKKADPLPPSDDEENETEEEKEDHL